MWRSGAAPGTRSAAEMLGLTGNSANAEVAVKERVNIVRNSGVLMEIVLYLRSFCTYYRVTAHVNVPQHVKRTSTCPPDNTVTLKIQDKYSS